MVKRMLIDATHSEETRVVVVSGNRLEEFDFETSTKKQLKGNIYLAKVTRVEPSLQAAFVDYGGNRHGFLAFSEIHPDYYRIPVEDREALIAETQADEGDDDEDETDADVAAASADDDETPEGSDPDEGDADEGDSDDDADDGDTADAKADEADGADTEADGGRRRGKGRVNRRAAANGSKPVETVGGDDEEDIQSRNRRFQRRYRIQEVISRRQILLVQVTKEERGNKGAALTTYISLAGRYCVLMPNTPRGGGISRKISNPADRKKLKTIVEDLDIPQGMAVIVRTAGSKRTKAEIRRDYDFLIRLWDEIRETTLNSTAPALVYEEANLIKRSLRDLYSKDIDEIFVEGDEGYKAAKGFMKQLIPSHAKRVQAYTDGSIPLFHRYQVESQLDNIHSPTVQLKSGGYIVMNSTEALVAIDVNSGKSTRERNIEATAYRTNLEAAEEIARQLRLRDLAGLIVIDFIDMEESRNRHNVERRLKEAMRNDRARIQLGRISPFGLLELSRQRLRPSILEASAQACPTCAGTGVVRSVESTALHVLRAIEEEGMRQRASRLTINVPTAVAFYILNQKRAGLTAIEERYGFEVFVEHDDSLVPPDYRLEREADRDEDDEDAARDKPRAEGRRESGERSERGRRRGRRRRDADQDGDEDRQDTESRANGQDDDEAQDGPSEERQAARRGDGEQEGGETRSRRRGRRGGRRRRRGRDRDAEASETTSGSDETQQTADAGDTGDTLEDDIPGDVSGTPDAPVDAAPAAEPAEAAAEDLETVEKAEEKPRRRSRRRAKAADAETEEKQTGDDGAADAAPSAAAEKAAPVEAVSEEEAPAKKPRRRRTTKAKTSAEAEASDKAKAETGETGEKTEAPEKPKRAPRRRKAAAAKDKADEAEAPAAAAADGDNAPAKSDSNGTDKTAGASVAETREVPAEAPAAQTGEAPTGKAPTGKAAAASDTAANDTSEDAPETALPSDNEEKPKKRRRGWWSLGG